MSRILFLSNGHGEDLSGSLLAKQLKRDGNIVNALPIVGKGIHYQKVKIKIIGKTREFSTGGIGYNSLKGRLLEIFGGEIIYLLQKLYLSYKLRKKYDFYIVVGDIVPVFFAWLAKKRFFTYLVAYSSHYEGQLRLPWPCKHFLISKNAKTIYARDFLTANDLTLQLRKKVLFLGNPFMDKFFLINQKTKISLLCVGLFPGSRFPETIDNLVSILEVLEVMAEISYFQKIEFNFALVNDLSKSMIKQILNKRNWKNPLESFENDVLKFQYQFITVNFKWNSFDEILTKSSFVISMAGTASEQAIGLAKPVIQIEGKGPQFTKSFAEAQRRLLGKNIFCVTNYKNKKDQINQTINLIIKVIYHIKLNKSFVSSCITDANFKLGYKNACTKIIEDINSVLKNNG